MPRALIIGGSLGGLFAALLLRQAGWEAIVLERAGSDLAGRGTGIGTHAEQLAIMRRLGLAVDEGIGVRISERLCLGADGSVVARLPFDKIMTSWAKLYHLLRAAVPDESYRHGMTLEAVEQSDHGVTGIFADGTRIAGDILVGADGLRSTVREACFDTPPPRYAGYVAWRGLIPEQQVPAIARADLLDRFGFFLTAREQILSYPVPGAEDDHRPGRRGFNWVWYHPVHETRTLPDLCTDAAGRTHALGIPPPLIRPAVLADFRAEAEAILAPQYAAVVRATPLPFFQPVTDLDSPRIVAGRVALIGDAAFVARPHVAAGVAKAALNAAWLADALAASGGDIDAGLAAYEARTLPFGQAMIARARYCGAPLEDPPRPGLAHEPLPVMRAIGAPLSEIPGLVL